MELVYGIRRDLMHLWACTQNLFEVAQRLDSPSQHARFGRFGKFVLPTYKYCGFLYVNSDKDNISQ